MDLILCHPSLSYKGGAERVVLEIARRFNPTIITTEYDKDSGFPEFTDFDVRIIRPALSPPIFRMAFASDRRAMVSAIAADAFLFHKIRDDYDVLNPHVVPSEWIRARNPRVCWYCHSPIRTAFEKSFNSVN